jgi:hypothetical protein
MKHKLSRHAPQGINIHSEVKYYITGLICAFFYSLLFLIRYGNALSNLYRWKGNERVLLTDAIMDDFVIILDTALMGFVIVALASLILVIYHYVYHHQGSKSIYLMKRLPNRWELHRRCLTLPLMGALLCLLAALILLLAYYGIYIACTPKECLSPGQWQKLWSVLL